MSDESQDESVSAEELDFETTNRSVEVVVVSNDRRLTSERLSKFEQTALVNRRAVKIAEDGNTTVEAGDLSDPVLIAKRELMQRKMPLMLSRPVGYARGDDSVLREYVEDWDPNVMAFSEIYDL